MSNDNENQIKHVYDGIEEQDNSLPRWWMGILFGTIVFAFAYWGYYEVAHAAPNPREEYTAKMEVLKKELEAKKPPSDDNLLAQLAHDEAAVKAGAEVFQTNCAACHGPQAQGVIGPNLTDNFWLHGNKPTQIVTTISNGVLEKGMPGWEKVLGPDRVRKVAAFVMAQKGKNVPGRPPQGDPVQE